MYSHDDCVIEIPYLALSDGDPEVTIPIVSLAQAKPANTTSSILHRLPSDLNFHILHYLTLADGYHLLQTAKHPHHTFKNYCGEDQEDASEEKNASGVAYSAFLKFMSNSFTVDERLNSAIRMKASLEVYREHEVPLQNEKKEKKINREINYSVGIFLLIAVGFAIWTGVSIKDFLQKKKDQDAILEEQDKIKAEIQAKIDSIYQALPQSCDKKSIYFQQSYLDFFMRDIQYWTSSDYTLRYAFQNDIVSKQCKTFSSNQCSGDLCKAFYFENWTLKFSPPIPSVDQNGYDKAKDLLIASCVVLFMALCAALVVKKCLPRRLGTLSTPESVADDKIENFIGLPGDLLKKLQEMGVDTKQSYKRTLKALDISITHLHTQKQKMINNRVNAVIDEYQFFSEVNESFLKATIVTPNLKAVIDQKKEEAKNISNLIVQANQVTQVTQLSCYVFFKPGTGNPVPAKSVVLPTVETTTSSVTPINQ